jgi:hypothetical protein
MKQSKIFIYALSIIAAFILIIVIIQDNKNCPKKECNNQSSCPEDQRSNDDIFINPINKFIVMV